jgi:hypothetical protein
MNKGRTAMRRASKRYSLARLTGAAPPGSAGPWARGMDLVVRFVGVEPPGRRVATADSGRRIGACPWPRGPPQQAGVFSPSTHSPCQEW